MTEIFSPSTNAAIVAANTAATKARQAQAAAEAAKAGVDARLTNAEAVQASAQEQLDAAEAAVEALEGSISAAQSAQAGAEDAQEAAEAAQALAEAAAEAANQGAAVTEAFEFIDGKNRYDAALAVDGKYLSDAASAEVTNTNWAHTGLIPVSEGVRYTLSIQHPNTFYATLHFYGAGGLAQVVGNTQTLVANLPEGMDIVTRSSGRERSFTVPESSGIAYLAVNLFAGVAHTTEQLEALTETIMLEAGEPATAYEAYIPDGIARVKDERLPESLTALSTRMGAAESILARMTGMTVIKSGNYVYVRTAWDDTRDLVQRMTLSTGAAFDNDPVNFSGLWLVDSSTANADLPTGTQISQASDDACPAYYNNTYMGANHGLEKAMHVTVTGHGKTVEDVGSQWVNGTGRNWYLLRVVDENTLWMLSENTGVGVAWNFSSVVGATLTHVAGATHTGTMTVASSAAVQLEPTAQNRQVSVLLDGNTVLTDDGVYACASLDIVNTYNVVDPVSMLAYVVSQVGSSEQPAFNHASIDADMRFVVTYRYQPNGAVTVYHSLLSLQDVTLGFHGFIQAGVLIYTGNQIWQYVPKTNPIVGTLKTWNLQATENIGTIEVLNLVPATWVDPNSPPDRMAQLVKTSGGDILYGLMIGYSLTHGQTVASVRKDVTTAGYVSSSRKQYPKAITASTPLTSGGTTLAANTLVDVAAYRIPVNPTHDPDATILGWYQDGAETVLIMDYHATLTMHQVALPAAFIGKRVTVIEKSSSLTLHSSQVSADGLYISVADNYGYAVLSLV